MKLCILSDASSLHISEWAQFFAQRGHDVSVISDNPADIDDITVYSISKYENKIHLPFISAICQIIRKARDIRRLIKTIQPDIFHSHYANIYGYLASLTGFHPHILTCHGSDLLVHPKRSKIEKYFVRRALSHADTITLPSKEMMQAAVEYGANPKKITQIQFGIDLHLFKFAVKGKDKARFLCTRMLTNRYRTDFIINAFSIITDRYNNATLDIIGDGPERNNLEKLVAAKSMDKRIKFWGKIKHSEIVRFYDPASFYITASPTDGISISLLEAFATGVYPILPDNSSNRGVADSGFNVTLYNLDSVDNLANTLENILKNPVNLDQKRCENRTLVEKKFNRDKNLALIETLYLNMITDS